MASFGLMTPKIETIRWLDNPARPAERAGTGTVPGGRGGWIECILRARGRGGLSGVRARAHTGARQSRPVCFLKGAAF